MTELPKTCTDRIDPPFDRVRRRSPRRARLRSAAPLPMIRPTKLRRLRRSRPTAWSVRATSPRRPPTRKRSGASTGAPGERRRRRSRRLVRLARQRLHPSGDRRRAQGQHRRGPARHRQGDPGAPDRDPRRPRAIARSPASPEVSQWSRVADRTRRHGRGRTADEYRDGARPLSWARRRAA